MATRPNPIGKQNRTFSMVVLPFIAISVTIELKILAMIATITAVWIF
jgi:hypothetical protein